MRTDIADAVLAGLRDGTVSKEAAVTLLQLVKKESPIAVIGLGSRTSDSDDYHDVWRTVKEGGSRIRRAPLLRGDQIAAGMPPGTHGGPEHNAKGAYIEDIGAIDKAVFGFDDQEAAHLLPHAKVVLTSAFRAVEDAGHVGEAATRYRTGVYVGYNHTKDHLQSFLGLAMMTGAMTDPQAAIFGSWTSGIATRISRAFDFRGPAYVIDAACASSTTAIATACDAIRSGRCDVAVAGGFYLDFTPVKLYNRGGLAVTPDDASVTKLYDRRNVGMYTGEYSGFAVLKSLDKAIQDGDRIHGVIEGWGISNNGSDGRFDQNAPDAVEQAMVDLIRSSNIDVDDIGLLLGEGYAHPMEEALDTMGPLGAIRRFSKRRQFAALTALTPNFGYLQSAVGIADLTVMLQALEHRLIPPLPHFDTPTDLMDLVDSPFYVPTSLEEWPESPNGRRLGIIYTNGFGGANSMLAVSGAPAPAPAPAPPTGTDGADTTAIYCASASDPQSFAAKLEADLAFLDEAVDEDFAAICHTSATRQHVHDGHRIAITAGSRAELVEILGQHVGGELTPPGVYLSSSLAGPRGRRRAAEPATPAEAAAAFARGGSPDLTAFTAPPDRRMIPLPRYQLRPTRSWPVPVPAGE
ncbi:polyketide synthase [Cryobacterium sp. 1639]|uniref:beta-ketoacyl synthase N-terminal-like domain-containing protein n=1 Tax=Cryobacterium inferilacus TaxID=2866629 RepID=UPI001C73360E|nr:polyketide synthase [Cryobacterium sp. 1639]MBX0301902.1 polyketide synthase [Cryobacterium sp. 1639]